MRSNVSAMVKMYSCGYAQDLTLPFVFNYKHSDGVTGGAGGCSVVLIVSPLVSGKPSPRKHTASRISSLVISPHYNHV